MYTTPIRPDELYHHGILGMKWGIRRFQPYPKGYHGKGKEVGEASKRPDPKTSKPAKPKEDIKSLSNEELQKRINRMQLEQRYTQLLKQSMKTAEAETPKKSKAREYVNQKMYKAGNMFVDSLIAMGVGYLAKNVAKSVTKDIDIRNLAVAAAMGAGNKFKKKPGTALAVVG